MSAFKNTDKVADHYDLNNDFAAHLNHMIPGFEYPDWSHKTLGEVLKAISTQHVQELLASLIRVDTQANDVLLKPAFDPCTPKGYSLVIADQSLQISYQDSLDSFFQGRIVDVRNALRDTGWDGPARSVSLQSHDGSIAVSFKPIQVGAGANVVGGSWSILKADKMSGSWTAVDEITDNLLLTSEQLASDINGRVQKELYDEVVGPLGWEPASEHTEHVFDKWGNKPYKAVFEKLMGGDGLPTYDLTILHEGDCYRAAHGSIVMPERLKSANEAADTAITWYVENAQWWNGSTLTRPEAVNSGIYSGQVLSIANGFATQKINREGATVKHDIARLSSMVHAGDVVEIMYSAGVGQVQDRVQKIER